MFLQHSGSDFFYFEFIIDCHYKFFNPFCHTIHISVQIVFCYCDSCLKLIVTGKLLCWLIAVDLETMNLDERIGLMEENMRRAMEDGMRQMREEMTGLILHNQTDRAPNPNFRPYED